jgi:PHD/YefM family antitoxin component YafN of YafNO toxin-antitoxin module
MEIRKKYIVDDKGNPKEVIIPLEDFEKIEELLGWDLDKGAIEQLYQAREDRGNRKMDAYVDVDSI